MARGRMISKSLSTSEKRAALHRVCPRLAEFCQALYPLMVAHADEQGRLPGDEFTVKNLIDPSSPRKLSDFTTALLSLHEVELILWYQVAGKKLIEIVAFADHQDLKGHHLRPGKLKPCPDESAFLGQKLQVGEVGESLPKPALREGNLREGKRREENVHAAENVPRDSAENAPSRVREFLIWFQTEYKARRNGAVYFVKWEVHGKLVKELLKTYEFERLQKHAQILLSTDEDWTSETDRGVGILSTKISWLEDKLCLWEAKRKAREAV